MEEKLRRFLEKYIDDPATMQKPQKDIVLPEDVDMLVRSAVYDHIEQEIIDYGTAHPEASFWDFHIFEKPGLGDGITEEELLADDDDEEES